MTADIVSEPGSIPTLPILFVEDDESVRLLADTILTRAGYTVRTAAGVKEALTILADPEAQFALVVTDIIMPGPSGSALITRLRTLRKDTPVLAVSGYSDYSGGELTLTELGVDDDIAFLAKPYGVAQLLSAVADVLAHRLLPGQSRATHYSSRDADY